MLEIAKDGMTRPVLGVCDICRGLVLMMQASKTCHNLPLANPGLVSIQDSNRLYHSSVIETSEGDEEERGAARGHG